MPRKPDFSVISRPARGTSVQEQALHLMSKAPVAPAFAGDFVKAMTAGFDLKGSPTETRVKAFRAVAAADTTKNEAVKLAAYEALFQFEPHNKELQAYLKQRLG